MVVVVWCGKVVVDDDEEDEDGEFCPRQLN